MSEVNEHVDHYFGVYRAIVISKSDPDRRFRLRVKIPQVHGDDDRLWAMPSLPATGAVMLPQAGSGVWVMFEGGDPEHPVWLGIFSPVTTQEAAWDFVGDGPPGDDIAGAEVGHRYLDRLSGNIYILDAD